MRNTGLWCGTVMLVLFGGSARALDCHLQDVSWSTAEVAVKVLCGDGSPDAVTYPEGGLYLGMSLYKPYIAVPSARMLKLEAIDHGSAYDLPPIKFEATQGTTEFRFPIEGRGDETHYLAAIWDQKNRCDESDYGRCDAVGFTLGRTDANGLPLPVDTLPRPFCDLDALDRAGLFEMIRRGEVYFDIQNTWPDEIQTLLYANDCWSYDPSLPGLGYSVMRWRVAPIPDS